MLLPEPTVAVDPAGHVLQGPRDQPAAADPSLFRVCDQTRALEHPQMLVDAGERDAKRARQLGEGRVARRQLGEDRAARGVGERCEGRIEGGAVILNHVVKLQAGPGACQAGRGFHRVRKGVFFPR